MKIAIWGVTGGIGRAIAWEALARGHQVTGLVRHPKRNTLIHPALTVRYGDVLNAALIGAEVVGHDAVVNSFGPNEDPSVVPAAAQALIAGLLAAKVKRLLIVGGAGSLEVAPGLQLVDSPSFPATWKPVALAHRQALEIYRQNTSLDWTYFSPAAMISPGTRRGHYRTGSDQLLTDAQGQSAISNEDFAVAILDEIETPRFVRQRLTVAY